MGHSILPPSSANIWGVENGCLGWVLMNQSFPSEANEYSIQGDAAHEVGAKLIDAGCRTGIGAPGIGDVCSNGVVIDAEMLQSAQEYAKLCLGLVRKHNVFGGKNLIIEKRLPIPSVHKECDGTLDFGLYSFSTNELYIVDYKHGKGVVEVFENPQLICYSSGAMDYYGINGAIDQYTKIHFYIVQPRAFHDDGIIRKWTVTASDLRGHINKISRRAHYAMSDNAPCRTGRYCKNCAALAHCDAAIQKGHVIYENIGSNLPKEISVDQLPILYDTVVNAKRHLEGLEVLYKEMIISKIREGHIVPQYELKQRKGNLDWKGDIADIKFIAESMGVDISKESLITPKQAIDKGLDKEVVEEFTERKAASLRLEKINLESVRRIFA